MNKPELIRKTWWVIPIIIWWLFLVSCTRKIYIPVEQKVTETVTLHDTIIQYQLDIIHDSIVTPDTISYLENKYSESYAKWNNGNLNHSLRTKDISLPVKVQYVEKEKQVEVPVPYPVEQIKYIEKELTWWQATSMWLGNILLVSIFLLAVIYFMRRK